MAGFLNFLPGEEKSLFVSDRKLNRDKLEEWGLVSLLRDCSILPDHVVVREGNGPGGTPGLFFYAKPIGGANPPSWTFSKDTQTWIKKGKRWIGWFNDHLPSPDELLRRNAMVPSPRGVIEDRIGNYWQLITARSFPSNSPTLPCTYSFDDNDNIVQTTDPEYEWIWELSGRIYTHFANQFADEGDLSSVESDAFLIESAAKVMGVNYRIGTAEITALDKCGVCLMTPQNVLRILMVLIDQPILDDFTAWLESQKGNKKKVDLRQQNLSSVSPGSKESTETIVQQEAL